MENQVCRKTHVWQCGADTLASLSRDLSHLGKGKMSGGKSPKHLQASRVTFSDPDLQGEQILYYDPVYTYIWFVFCCMLFVKPVIKFEVWQIGFV